MAKIENFAPRAEEQKLSVDWTVPDDDASGKTVRVSESAIRQAMGASAQTPQILGEKQGSRGILPSLQQNPEVIAAAKKQLDEKRAEEARRLAWQNAQGKPSESDTSVVNPFKAEEYKGKPQQDEALIRIPSDKEIDQRLEAIRYSEDNGLFDTAKELRNKLSKDTISSYADSEIPPKVKKLIAAPGRWVLRGHLGSGGMGTVYRTEDLILHREAAIKVFVPRDNEGLSADLLSRFNREGRSLAKLNSPYVVRVSQAGFSEQGGFIAMDLVDGQDLAASLEHQLNPYSVDEMARIGLDVANGLGAMHEKGIVHRDVKPANILFSNRLGHHIIADFGLTYLLNNDAQSEKAEHASSTPDTTADLRLTDPKFIMGTPYYMAPENLHGSDNISPAADIWALGVMLYEMSSGKRPFEGDSAVQIIEKISRMDFVPLHTLRPDLPESFLGLVKQMLDRDPLRRPKAGAVAAQLKDILFEKHIAVVKSPERTSKPSDREPTATSIIRSRPVSADAITEISRSTLQVDDTEIVGAPPAEEVPTVADNPSGWQRLVKSISSLFGR